VKIFNFVFVVFVWLSGAPLFLYGQVYLKNLLLDYTSEIDASKA